MRSNGIVFENRSSMLEPLKFVAVFEAVMIAGAGGLSERNFVREGGLAG